MALEVEDGTGKANADAYVDAAYVDAYVAKFLGGNAAWDGASEAAKEAAIVRFTQYLDLVYRQDFRGVKRTDEQSREWPRSFVYADSGRLLSDTLIPEPLKHASAEGAVRALVTTELIPDLDPSSQGIKSESVAVDTIKESIEYVGTKPTTTIYRKLTAVLSKVLNGTSGQVVRG